MKISVAIITHNEEANLARTLAAVAFADEIVVVDSGSTDRTVEMARASGTKVFTEPWQGFAKQKNSAITKCTGEWVLSIDADEEVSAELRESIKAVLASAEAEYAGYKIPRRNMFLSKWIRFGGYYPDAKLRLFRRGAAQYEDRAVHEDAKLEGATGRLQGYLIHRAYPTLSEYIEHMNRYSSLGAEMAAEKGRVSHSLPAFMVNIFLNPLGTFIYNYIFRLGFLDGREGLLLHTYHSVYVSWKYAKAWEENRWKRKQDCCQ
jgi:glycosyltransferase involved in cell wall biosynthesis